jgi:hypothetical protein
MVCDFQQIGSGDLELNPAEGVTKLFAVPWICHGLDRALKTRHVTTQNRGDADGEYRAPVLKLYRFCNGRTRCFTDEVAIEISL